MLYGDPLDDRSPALQMLDNDTLTARGRDASVPDALWVNHQPRAIMANAQTGGLSAQRGNSGFLKAALEIVPRGLASVGSATGGTNTKENVSASGAEIHRGKGGISTGIAFGGHRF